MTEKKQSQMKASNIMPETIDVYQAVTSRILFFSVTAVYDQT